MQIVKLDQHGPDWHKWRQEGVGGSDIPVIMGDVTWSSEEDLAKIKLGLSESVDNERMARGRRLEPRARVIYEALHGVTMPPACCLHDTYSWLRASLDGLSEDQQTVLEIKCPSDNAHKKALEGCYPWYYRAQLQQQLLVTGAARLHYWSFTDAEYFGLRDRFALVEVLPNYEYHEKIIRKVKAFLRRIGKLPE